MTFSVIATDPSFLLSTNPPNVESTYPSGTVFPVGVTTNVCTVRDTFGNQSSCSLTVTGLDLDPPVIQAPSACRRK